MLDFLPQSSVLKIIITERRIDISQYQFQYLISQCDDEQGINRLSP